MLNLTIYISSPKFLLTLYIITLSEKLSPMQDLLQPPKELMTDSHTPTDRQSNYFCMPAWFSVHARSPSICTGPSTCSVPSTYMVCVSMAGTSAHLFLSSCCCQPMRWVVSPVHAWSPVHECCYLIRYRIGPGMTGAVLCGFLSTQWPHVSSSLRCKG